MGNSHSISCCGVMALDLYLEDEGKYDNAFLSVLQDVGKINPFLEHLFSFLRRRTDFYLLLDNEGKFGFAPGAAEKMVLSVSICFNYIHSTKAIKI